MTLPSSTRTIVAVAAAVTSLATVLPAQATRFEVTVSPAAHVGPLTGRLVVAIARRADPEPRLLISPSGPGLYAVDLDHLAPGAPAMIDTSTSPSTTWRSS
jgi:hypothetical protein